MAISRVSLAVFRTGPLQITPTCSPRARFGSKIHRVNRHSLRIAPDERACLETTSSETIWSAFSVRVALSHLPMVYVFERRSLWNWGSNGRGAPPI
jgi:hypothetical protein